MWFLCFDTKPHKPKFQRIGTSASQGAAPFACGGRSGSMAGGVIPFFEILRLGIGLVVIQPNRHQVKMIEHGAWRVSGARPIGAQRLTIEAYAP